MPHVFVAAFGEVSPGSAADPPDSAAEFSDFAAEFSNFAAVFSDSATTWGDSGANVAAIAAEKAAPAADLPDFSARWPDGGGIFYQFALAKVRTPDISCNYFGEKCKKLRPMSHVFTHRILVLTSKRLVFPRFQQAANRDFAIQPPRKSQNCPNAPITRAAAITKI